MRRVRAVKPPNGVMPRRNHEEIRIAELIEAIKRYINAGIHVPTEWLDEYNELISRRANN